jgi:signal transduction histidine kinase
LRDNDRAAVASDAGLMSLELIPVRGEERTFSSAKAPYRVAGELVGNISISRDVTQQKSDERALREALAVRDEFLAIASHELRTPLAALTLQVSGLERALRETSTTTGEVRPELQRARRAVAQVDRLVRLVENLLDVSRISTGRLQLQHEAFDLAELVRLVVAGLREQATRAGCVTSVRLSGEVTGTWDRSRIEQVITNLLTNAFKYGAGKPVEVSVEASEAVAALRVRDHGTGIAAEPVDRIFERFERAATGHHQKSLGVGLYIARQVIDAHAGTICVESTSEGGTTFLVELPRQPLEQT